jgi:hypothetical protein
VSLIHSYSACKSCFIALHTIFNHRCLATLLLRGVFCSPLGRLGLHFTSSYSVLPETELSSSQAVVFTSCRLLLSLFLSSPFILHLQNHTQKNRHTFVLCKISTHRIVFFCYYLSTFALTLVVARLHKLALDLIGRKKTTCYATFYSLLPPNPQLAETPQLHFATHSKSHSGHVPFFRFWHKKWFISDEKNYFFENH